jgi:putative acetyltransferase
MQIRTEHAGDLAAIRDVTEAAFRAVPHSSGSEARIIDALRESGALALSLVAESDGEIVGQVAFSPVRINFAEADWYGLGPVSVRPDVQRRGIGQALIREGLGRLAGMGAQGCVLLGDPVYYSRFGFRHDPALKYAVAFPQFQQLAFGGSAARGVVTYHPAFDEH